MGFLLYFCRWVIDLICHGGCFCGLWEVFGWLVGLVGVFCWKVSVRDVFVGLCGYYVNEWILVGWFGDDG
jgi:hypothetical protein